MLGHLVLQHAGHSLVQYRKPEISVCCVRRTAMPSSFPEFNAERRRLSQERTADNKVLDSLVQATPLSELERTGLPCSSNNGEELDNVWLYVRLARLQLCDRCYPSNGFGVSTTIVGVGGQES